MNAQGLMVIPPESGALATLDERIDQLENAMLERGNVIDLPVVHRFTPGMYSRELCSPANVLATTYIHLIEHQFVLVAGTVSTYVDGEWVRISAPFHGITKVGTRRVVYVHEPAIWTTFHPTLKTTVEEVEAEIFGVRVQPDGSNIRDRYEAALKSQAIAGGRGMPLVAETNTEIEL